MKLDAMALFALVAREGSFTAAARVSGLPKSTVSQRVAELEERIAKTRQQFLIRIRSPLAQQWIAEFVPFYDYVWHGYFLCIECITICSGPPAYS